MSYKKSVEKRKSEKERIIQKAKRKKKAQNLMKKIINKGFSLSLSPSGSGIKPGARFDSSISVRSSTTSTATSTASAAETNMNSPCREKLFVEHCKGVNGLEKVVLREVRGCSAEVSLAAYQSLSYLFIYS